MVLVTEIRAFMLLRPARVLVLLAIFGRLGFPVFRRFAFLERLVVLARIVLLGRRHDRRIDDLPAPGEIALVLQEPIKQLEQLFHRAAPRDKATESWRREPHPPAPNQESA